MEIPAATIWLTSAAIYLFIGLRFAEMIDDHNRRVHYKHLGRGFPVVMILWPILVFILKVK